MPIETQVLVVGGGPVGLTLAIALGQRGIKVVIVEAKPKPDFLPKMELCNARTMEMFGRLGLADRIRRAGYDRNLPMDVWVTPSLNSTPIVRLTYPSIEKAQAAIAAADSCEYPREAYQRISQYVLEPLLKEVAEATPNVTVMFGAKLESFAQDEGSVLATIAVSNDLFEIKSEYLAGCDGATSTVRRQLGVALEGTSLGQRNALIFFRSPDLRYAHPLGPARHYYIGGEINASLITQNDLDHYSVNAEEHHGNDPLSLIHKVVGAQISAEILNVGYWTPNLLVADRYHVGRAFLAGDAAHQYIPTGGFGMNTGIGDAVDLAWKLAGALQGWGGPALLPSYDTERRAVGLRNRSASEYAAKGSRAWRKAVSNAVEHQEPLEGALTELVAREQRKSHEMKGVELSYSYAGSPLILEGAVGEDTSDEASFAYAGAVVLGARLPHAWVSPGRSVHDCIGSGFTLLSFNYQSSFAPLEHSFQKLGAPLEIVAIDHPRIRKLYGDGLILVRPDLHVVWRGAIIEDADLLAELATGHVPEHSTQRSRTRHASFPKESMKSRRDSA